MPDTTQKSWVEQLEVTAPIKALMGYVDELSANYDRRVAAMHTDYKKDIDDIVTRYKQEKQEFLEIVHQQKDTNARLQQELTVLQETYKALEAEYKLNADNLADNRKILTTLTAEFKQETELLNIAQERIRTTNEQIKLELTARNAREELPAGKIRFGKTRGLLKKIFLRSKKKQEGDLFSY